MRGVDAAFGEPGGESLAESLVRCWLSDSVVVAVCCEDDMRTGVCGGVAD